MPFVLITPHKKAALPALCVASIFHQVLFCTVYCWTWISENHILKRGDVFASMKTLPFLVPMHKVWTNKSFIQKKPKLLANKNLTTHSRSQLIFKAWSEIRFNRNKTGWPLSHTHKKLLWTLLIQIKPYMIIHAKIHPPNPYTFYIWKRLGQ